MSFLPPLALQHLLDAVRAEIERLESIHALLPEGADWPDDYDPNDLALYRGAVPSLEAGVRTGLRFDEPLAKPVRFLMMLIPGYAKRQGLALRADDLAVVHRAYCDYVAELCLACLPIALERPNSSYAEWIRRSLVSLLEFPRLAGDEHIGPSP